MVNHVGSSAGLVEVLGGCSGVSLLQLLGHQLLGFHRRRGRGATVGDRWARLLKDTLLDFLLLLQGFDKRSFQPLGMLSFQNLFLIGRHAVFTEDCPAFCLVVPPAAGEVGFALGAGEGVSGNGLGQCYTCLSWRERDGKLTEVLVSCI